MCDRLNQEEYQLIPGRMPRGHQMSSGITPHQLTGRKRRLVNADVIPKTTVNFVIVPLTNETNIYTVKLDKGEDINDPFELNLKYKDVLRKWICETRQRPNGHYDTKKRTQCRSRAEVRRFIFEGFEKLKVEVDPETNTVKETKIGAPKQHSKKRKTNSSSPPKLDKPFSSNVSMNVLHVEPFLRKGNSSSFANLDLHKIVPQHKENEEVKNEELVTECSYNEENMEQVVIPQSLEIWSSTEISASFDLHEVVQEKEEEGRKAIHVEKKLPCEDNYAEEEIILKMTRRESALQIFILQEVVSQDSAKEGNKTMIEDAHEKKELLSYEDIFPEHREVEDEVNVSLDNIDDFDLFREGNFSMITNE
ncbi:hypothetical protein RND71_035077 [Anisodus tanguticus]|uniref:Uncharacterized protein n=1 Tax=Anisodus tanguticus TaxID=243964 RepID=A0AAE1R4U2_9SOLA|nr:hypothetical protein RND71_035077 [Anisodus tanguticus]